MYCYFKKYLYYLYKFTLNINKRLIELTQKVNANPMITNNKNLITYVKNLSIEVDEVNKKLQVIIQLPSFYDKDKYVGRVYIVDIEFILYYAKIDKNASKNEDNIIDSKIYKFFNQFIFDSTWKSKIKPYDIKSPTIIKNIPEIYNLEYTEFIDKINNKIIYEYNLKEKNIYIVFENKIEFFSVYPNMQLPENLNIEYKLI